MKFGKVLYLGKTYMYCVQKYIKKWHQEFDPEYGIYGKYTTQVLDGFLYKFYEWWFSSETFVSNIIITSSNQRLWECVRRLNFNTDTLND